MQIAGDIINREVAEIEFPNLNTAVKTDAELRDLLNNVVPELIYESYLKYFNPDKSIRIEKLHLDLGEIKLRSLKDSFIKSLNKELDKEFSALAFSLTKTSQDTSSGIDIQHQSQVVDSALLEKTDFYDGIKNHSVSDESDLIKHYLFNGTLPWWTDRHQSINMFELLKSAEKSQDSYPFDLMLKIVQNEVAFERFIINLSHEDFLKITEQLIHSLPPGLKQTTKLLLNDKKIIKSDLPILFAASVIETILHGQYSTPKTFLSEFIKIYSAAYTLPKNIAIKNTLLKIVSSKDHLSTKDYKIHLSAILLISYEENIHLKDILTSSFFNELESVSEFLKSVKEILTEHKSKIGKEQINFLDELIAYTNNSVNDVALFKSSDLKAYPTLNVIISSPTITTDKQDYSVTISELASRLCRLVKSSSEVKKKTKELKIEWDTFDKDEKHFIGNAGICLLTPFLPLFFKKLKLTEEGDFKNSEFKKRSVRILQYIVDNKNDTGEHLLQFNKLLCGLPINYPIDISVEINNNEIEEIDKLLKSVISHWSALKNTSVEGFRGAFLQRDGSLMENDDCWSLRVERESQDVLLETIPWNYILIKYKWMGKLIRVEW